MGAELATHPIGAPAVPVGLGYRRVLHDALMAAASGSGSEATANHHAKTPLGIDFLEVAPENYLGLGGRRRRQLTEVSNHWPIITHGLAMSLAGSAPLDARFVDAVAGFVRDHASPWHSDHLCASAAHGSHTHELLPAVMSMTNAKRVAGRIRDVQSSLDVPFAIENVSAYGRRADDTMNEADFVAEVIERADCHLLLDVNNVFVNAHNFGFDALEMLTRLPLERTLQIHIAGHTSESPDLLIDTHGAPVAEPVLALLATALERTGPVPILLERDHQIPELSVLSAEVAAIRAIGRAVLFPSGNRRADQGVTHALACA